MTWCMAPAPAPARGRAAPRCWRWARRSPGADVVLLAVPGGAVTEVVAANGAALAGKVVIDA